MRHAACDPVGLWLAAAVAWLAPLLFPSLFPSLVSVRGCLGTRVATAMPTCMRQKKPPTSDRCAPPSPLLSGQLLSQAYFSIFLDSSAPSRPSTRDANAASICLARWPAPTATACSQVSTALLGAISPGECSISSSTRRHPRLRLPVPGRCRPLLRAVEGPTWATHEHTWIQQKLCVRNATAPIPQPTLTPFLPRSKPKQQQQNSTLALPARVRAPRSRDGAHQTPAARRTGAGPQITRAPPTPPPPRAGTRTSRHDLHTRDRPCSSILLG